MTTTTRRRWLMRGVGLAAAGAPLAASYAATAAPRERDDDLSPTEDLMREHGVIARILLAYDEAIRRIDADQPVPLAAVHDAAVIVRTFVEDYHERLEEQHVFPVFERNGRYVELVETLRRQHDAGRRLTAQVLRAVRDRELSEPLRAFVHMYRPHAAREDTVLFPALRQVLGRAALRRLGRTFAELERDRFGEDGFARVLVRVVSVEDRLDIGDLRRVTP